MFTHPVHLRGVRLKFVDEGHRVKVKVTGAKKVSVLSERKPACQHRSASR